MTCYRSRSNWHSYVKNSLDAVELHELTAHLTKCPECREIVSVIQKTAYILAESRAVHIPPVAIKINVMQAIDKSRYKKGANSSHLFELRNWGLSMVAAGLLLFALNLTSLTPNFENGRVAELNIEIGRKIAIPFDKMSQVAHDALGQIEALTLSRANKN